MYIGFNTYAAMNFPVHFSNQLREHLKALRKERGLTQAALGQLLGVGQARIAEIENNPGVVSVDQLMKVLSALRASMVLRDDDAAVQAPPVPKALSGAGSLPDARPPAAPRRSIRIRPKKGSW
ncbi:Antitoxin HipB [compost metagenome]